MADIHVARIAAHRSFRRLAAELLADYLPLPCRERADIFRAVVLLIGLRSKDIDHIEATDAPLTREAAHLFARLPDDKFAALKTLDILEKLLDYIDDGVIDISGAGPHVHVIEDTLIAPTKHLRLVETEPIGKPEHAPPLKLVSDL